VLATVGILLVYMFSVRRLITVLAESGLSLWQATLPPKMDPGAFSGQRQGWKIPRGPSGSALLLCM